MDDKGSTGGEPCPPPRPALPVTGSPEDEVDLAVIAKALGHPVRVRILRILVERKACLCGELVAELPVSQATVSEHLRVLKDAGLVRGDVDGPRVCYCASLERLERLADLVSLLHQSGAAKESEVLTTCQSEVVTV